MPVIAARLKPDHPAMPRLEAGDHLDQPAFHARYKAMPASFCAELIGGIVIVPSPLLPAHGEFHALMMGWLLNPHRQPICLCCPRC